MPSASEAGGEFEQQQLAKALGAGASAKHHSSFANAGHKSAVAEASRSGGPLDRMLAAAAEGTPSREGSLAALAETEGLLRATANNLRGTLVAQQTHFRRLNDDLEVRRVGGGFVCIFL